MIDNDNAVSFKTKSKAVKQKDKLFIAIFIVIALSSGWIGLLIDKALPEQLDEQSLGMGIWLILPFLCSIIIRALRKDWKDIGVKPRFKENAKWYFVAILFFPVITLLYTLLAWLVGLVSFSNFSDGSFLPIITSLFIGLFIKNIFEDFAWQGFLTPKLLTVKMNDFKIYMVVGLVWAFWHAPYYLYYLPDSMYASSSDRILDAFIKSPIIITFWAVVFVEMTRITRSVWPAVLMHTFEDAVPNFLIFDEKIIQFAGIGDVLLNPITGVLPIATFLTFGLWLRKKRIDRDEQLIRASDTCFQEEK